MRDGYNFINKFATNTNMIVICNKNHRSKNIFYALKMEREKERDYESEQFL